MSKILDRLLEYDSWANAAALNSIRSATAFNLKAARLLAHLLVAEMVWMMRLNGEETSNIVLRPEFSLEECEKLALENKRAYDAYLSDSEAEKLDSIITYRNSKGLEFQTSVRDILSHVLLHGAYHRGQIAAAVRGAGDQPVNTDYITFTREM